MRRIISSVACPAIPCYIICGLSRYTMLYHLWPVPLYHVISCGLSRYTMLYHLWPVPLYHVISSVACPAIPYFPILSLKRHYFRKKRSLMSTIFLFCSQISPATFLTAEDLRAMLPHCHIAILPQLHTGPPVRYRLFVSAFNKT